MNLSEFFIQTATQTMSNVISNLAWFILFVWGVKTIAREMPKWLAQYTKSKAEENKLVWAMSIKK